MSIFFIDLEFMQYLESWNIEKSFFLWGGVGGWVGEGGRMDYGITASNLCYL